MNIVMNLLHEEKVSLRDQLHIGKSIDYENQNESLHHQQHDKIARNYNANRKILTIVSSDCTNEKCILHASKR